MANWASSVPRIDGLEVTRIFEPFCMQFQCQISALEFFTSLLGGTLLAITGATSAAKAQGSASRSKNTLPSAEVDNFLSITRMARSSRGDSGAAQVGYTPPWVGALPSNIETWLDQQPIRPEYFGAKGDGISDDLEAIIKASAAAVQTGQRIEFSGRRYKVSDTCPFFSKVYYSGVKGRTEIYSITPNKPIGASASWLGVGPTEGRLRMSGISFVSEIDIPGITGFIARDYWSEFEDIEAKNCAGGGLAQTHLDRNGKASGKLVENRWISPRSRNCGGIGLDMGIKGNAKLTDGWLIDPLVQAGPNQVSHIRIGASAGWVLKAGHIYGPSSSYPLQLENAFNTDVDCYIEKLGNGRAISCTGVQRSLSITARILTGNAVEGSTCVFLSKSPDFQAPGVFADIQIDHGIPFPISAIYSEGDLHVNLRATISGKYAPLVSLASGKTLEAQSLIRRANNIVLDGALTDNPSKGTLRYEGLALQRSISFTHVPSASVNSVHFLLNLGSAQIFHGLLLITSSSASELRMRWSSPIQFFIDTKGKGQVILFDDTSSRGFSSPPFVSIRDTKNDEISIEVTYKSSTDDDTGILSLLFASSDF